MTPHHFIVKERNGRYVARIVDVDGNVLWSTTRDYATDTEAWGQVVKLTRSEIAPAPAEFTLQLWLEQRTRQLRSEHESLIRSCELMGVDTDAVLLAARTLHARPEPPMTNN